MFVVNAPTAFVPRLFVFDHVTRSDPPAFVPHNTHAIVGTPPSDVKSPFSHAVVVVTFVAPLALSTAGTVAAATPAMPLIAAVSAAVTPGTSVAASIAKSPAVLYPVKAVQFADE